MDQAQLPAAVAVGLSGLGKLAMRRSILGCGFKAAATVELSRLGMLRFRRRNLKCGFKAPQVNESQGTCTARCCLPSRPLPVGITLLRCGVLVEKLTKGIKWPHDSAPSFLSLQPIRRLTSAKHWPTSPSLASSKHITSKLDELKPSISAPDYTQLAAVTSVSSSSPTTTPSFILFQQDEALCHLRLCHHCHRHVSLVALTLALHELTLHFFPSLQLDHCTWLSGSSGTCRSKFCSAVHRRCS